VTDTFLAKTIDGMIDVIVVGTIRLDKLDVTVDSITSDSD